MPESGSLPLYDVYVDESSQTNHRYLVLGGLIVPNDAVADTVGLLWKARQLRLPAGEMKWGKVSRAKMDAYKAVLDVFFQSGFREIIHFHSLVVDTTKLKHAVYNQGSREIGFSKEVYQLLMKFGRLYGGIFHVYADKRTTPQSPEELRLILNRGMRKKGDRRDWPFRRLQFRESKETLPLQVTDLLLGAIAFHLNGHADRPDASAAKIELSNHVLAEAGIADVFRDTNVSGKFTIWHRRLR